METLKDLVAAAREHDGTVLDVAGRNTPYTYSDFVPNVWKTGNLLGHYGVHPGASVTVVPGPKAGEGERIDAIDPILGVVGATLVGASVSLVPDEPVDSRALIVPAARAGAFETAPSCSVIAYGGPPDDPAVVHFEQERWSENPIEPPESVAADDPALVHDGTTFTHGDLIAAAKGVVTDHDLGEESTVVLDAALDGPGALVAGVLAPVVAGAQIRLPAATAEPDQDGTLIVTDTELGKQQNVLRPAQLTRSMRDTRRA